MAPAAERFDRAVRLARQALAEIARVALVVDRRVGTDEYRVDPVTMSIVRETPDVRVAAAKRN